MVVPTGRARRPRCPALLPPLMRYRQAYSSASVFGEKLTCGTHWQCRPALRRGSPAYECSPDLPLSRFCSWRGAETPWGCTSASMPAAVVADLDQLRCRRVRMVTRYCGGACVDGVLHQLLHHRGGALHHLACGNQLRRMLVQHMYHCQWRHTVPLLPAGPPMLRRRPGSASAHTESSTLPAASGSPHPPLAAYPPARRARALARKFFQLPKSSCVTLSAFGAFLPAPSALPCARFVTSSGQARQLRHLDAVAVVCAGPRTMRRRKVMSSPRFL